MSDLRRSWLKTSSALAASLIASAAIFASARAWGGEPVRLETLKTHSRLVFRLDRGVDEVPVEMKNTAQGFRVLFKGLDLADLGAPLGEERAWAEALAARHGNDPRVQSIQLRQTPQGVVAEGKWKYPSGPNAPAQPRMEAFDYRDKASSQYVLDFWVRKTVTVAEVEAAKRQEMHQASIKKAEAEAKRRAERKIASEARKNAAINIDRFCKDALTDQNDVVLPFIPFHEPVDFTRYIPIASPDANYQFRDPQGNSKDAQYVRLALKLYRDGKLGLALRTLEFFDAEHPSSMYRLETRFLRANIYFKLGMFQESDQLLQRLMLDSQESAVALHSAMYLAARHIQAGSHLLALDPFLWLVSHHPDHRLSWLFHLGVAESFYALKQTERAAKEYRWVIDHAVDRKQKAEAAIRMGDLYMARFQYEEALAAYFQGINYFGEEAGEFPSIHINRAEALYGLRNFDRAKVAFENFLKRFPDHTMGWRATYRLAEIASRNADPAARAHYLETVNRYPVTPGATLARMRLATCGDQAGMNAETGMRFFANEAAKFTGDGELAMVRYTEYKYLAEIRALVTWSRRAESGQAQNREEAARLELDAMETAIRALTPNRTPEFKAVVKPMIGALFRRRIETMLADGQKAEAIELYQQRNGAIPWEERFSEPSYILKLSLAASDLGFGKLAKELAEVYQEGPKKHDRAMLAAGERQAEEEAAEGRAPAAAQAKRARQAAEDMEDPEIRMRVYEAAFSEAKALWITTNGERKESNDKIRAALAKVGEESPHSYEREIILGLMDQREGREKPALGHALKAQLLRPSRGAAERDARLEGWVALLQAKGGDQQVALRMLRSLEDHVRERRAEEREPAAQKDGKNDDAAIREAATALGVPVTPSLETLILTQAQILDRVGRWGEAAQAYSRAMDAGVGGGQAVYGYAKALLNTGEAESKARGIETLQKLADGKIGGNPSELWKRLALEALENETGKPANAKEGKK